MKANIRKSNNEKAITTAAAEVSNSASYNGNALQAYTGPSVAGSLPENCFRKPLTQLARKANKRKQADVLKSAADNMMSKARSTAAAKVSNLISSTHREKSVRAAKRHAESLRTTEWVENAGIENCCIVFIFHNRSFISNHLRYFFDRSINAMMIVNCFC